MSRHKHQSQHHKSQHHTHKATTKGPRFSGGDHLEGAYQLAHQLMMQNELHEGYGAYQLSYAGTAESGLTFGGNQMDLHGNLDTKKLFLKLNLLRSSTIFIMNFFAALRENLKIVLT